MDTTLRPVTLAEFMPLPDSEGQYPLEYIEANSAIKLREDEDSVVVGICNPENAALLTSLPEFSRQGR